jgi:uncharacterized protein (DUF362 family)
VKPIVFVEKLALDENSQAKQFGRSFASLSLVDDFIKAKAVFIKPNLTYPHFKKGVTTQKQFIESFVASLRKINSSTKIYIGEGEGGYNSFSISDAMTSMGFFEIMDKYPNVIILNLTRLPTRRVEVHVKGNPYILNLPTIIFEEIDFSITCPLPKVHCMTKVSLAYKNQWGCLPDVMRLKNHYMFDYIISKISDILKFKYAFLDGRYGLNNNGPMVGDPIEVNWFVASNSLGAFDMVVSEMMGFDWRIIGHLKIAKKYGLLPEREDIDIIGDIESLKRKFDLKRNFWNYPALAAFHSKKLTHLFYFSKWAKLLHDVMYTFRERPIVE